MTKKDYEEAAKIISEVRWGQPFGGRDEPLDAEGTIWAFVQFFSRDNPRFSETIFRAAIEDYSK